jgi:23S rRNA (cytidine1920-2'-O)/16S rRNA (cytidine1409-2'-O)-methyltransferase
MRKNPQVPFILLFFSILSYNFAEPASFFERAMTKSPRKPKLKDTLRVDALLVDRGLARSLDHARALIMAGEVFLDQRAVAHGSDRALAEAALTISPRRPFVSRGGEKLHHALIDLGLQDALKDKIVLDVGASTGGFTHCALLAGARQVIALDVGVNLLDWSLRNDPRVICLEGTHIKDFKPDEFPAIDWVVADVSFNSLQRLAPALRRSAPRTGVNFLLLIKPQFELDAEDVPHGGVVADDALRTKAVQSVSDALREVGLISGRHIDSRVQGRKGNREIFFLATADRPWTQAAE